MVYVHRFLFTHYTSHNVTKPLLQNDWPEGQKLAGSMNFKFPTVTSTDLNILIPSASKEGIKIMMEMISWNPKSRPTSKDSLHYDYFRANVQRTTQISSKRPLMNTVQNTPAITTEMPSIANRMTINQNKPKTVLHLLPHFIPMTDNISRIRFLRNPIVENGHRWNLPKIGISTLELRKTISRSP